LSGIIKDAMEKQFAAKRKQLVLPSKDIIFSFALQCNAPKLAHILAFVGVTSFRKPKGATRASRLISDQRRNHYDAPVFCLSTKYYRNGINVFGMLKHFSG
jgi:hypothetical protein